MIVATTTATATTTVAAATAAAAIIAKSVPFFNCCQKQHLFLELLVAVGALFSQTPVATVTVVVLWLLFQTPTLIAATSTATSTAT